MIIYNLIVLIGKKITPAEYNSFFDIANQVGRNWGIVTVY